MAAGGDLRLEVPYGGVPQWLAARRLAPEGGGVREVLALRRRATPLMAAAADVVRAALPPGTRVEDGEVLLGDYDAVWVALLEDATRRGVAGRTLFGAVRFERGASYTVRWPQITPHIYPSRTIRFAVQGPVAGDHG